MDLWTEFEGVTIDSSFALNKLLQTEGRSAFFSTLNAKGESVLIRIIECHFDEDEILARWRGVQALGHANFLRLDRFGQFRIEEDDITAVYAVFDRVDANLGQVLEKGRLSASDATQIGLSIASALEALHASGFVHQHVEPSYIFAVGETVKLRSDCIRETPEGEAGVQARRRDVHDLAVVLMQVLLGMPHTDDTASAAALPAPFPEIVRKGMGGEWGMGEIKLALASLQGGRSKTPDSKPAPKPGGSVASTPKPSLANNPAPRAGVVQPKPQARLQADDVVEDGPELRPRPATAGGAGFRSPRTFDDPERAGFQLPGWFRRPDRLWLERVRFDRLSPSWIGAGAFLLLVMLAGWIFGHRFFNHPTTPVTVPATAVHANTSSTHARPAPSSASKSPATPMASAATRRGADWRVVAYTYNHKDQAQKKAASLTQNHPELQPQVFSPRGKSPWLVTVGGALERDQAYALARKARTLGLPRDTYAQNYTAH